MTSRILQFLMRRYFPLLLLVLALSCSSSNPPVEEPREITEEETTEHRPTVPMDHEGEMCMEPPPEEPDPEPCE